MRRFCVAHVFVIASFLATAAQAQVGPQLSTSFTPNTIGVGNATRLTIIVTNPDSTPYGNVNLVDMLPVDLSVSQAPQVAIDNCGANPQVMASPGGSSITVADAQVAPGSSCTIGVNVTHGGVSGGTLTNFINGSSDFGPFTTADATLTVDANRIQLTKTFSDPTPSIGDIITLTFTLTNPSGSNVFNVTFTDPFPAILEVAPVPNVTSDCIGSFMLQPGDVAANFFSGFLMPAQSCTLSVDLLVTGVGEGQNATASSNATNGIFGFATDRIDVAFEAFRKAFDEPLLFPGATTELRFFITNIDRNNAATGITFTDDLDAALSGVTAINTPIADVCGSGSQLTGSSVLSLGGGLLPPGGTCEFSVTVQIPVTASAGTYTNVTSTLTATGGTLSEPPATDVFSVQPVPILSKTFLSDPARAGETVSIEFTIANTSSTTALTDISFTDEHFLGIDTPGFTNPPAASFCGSGSVATIIPGGFSGPQQFNVMGANLAAGASCTFTVDFILPEDVQPGQYTNTTGPIMAMADSDVVLGATASDDLTIIGAPVLTKGFNPIGVTSGGTSTIEFTLSLNPNATVGATDIEFTDDLNAALAGLIATNLPLSDVCGAGSSLTGSSLLTFTGGVLAAGDSCTFSVDVQVPAAAAPGTYTNITSDVSAMVGGQVDTSPAASADLQVVNIQFTKEFLEQEVVRGEQVTLRFTIDNQDPINDATGIFFTDDLPGNMIAVTSPPNPCGPGSSFNGVGMSFVFLTGGEVAAGTSCTFDVTVAVGSGDPIGEAVNQTSILTATVGGNAVVVPAATDSVSILQPLLLTKTFTDDPAAPGSTATLEFTIVNLDDDSPATNLAFTDDLDAALAGLTAVGLPTNNICGAGSQLSGTSTLSFTGGTVAPNSSCTFSVTVQVPMTTASTALNTTSTLSGSVDFFPQTAPAATDTLQVQQLALSKSFDGPTTATGTAVLTFTIENLDLTNPVTGLAFSDDLDATLSGLTSGSAMQTDVCGVGSEISGFAFLVFSGGSLAPGERCSFAVMVQVPAAVMAGTYPNATTDLSANGVVVAPPALSDLVIEPAPTFAKSFAPNPIGLNQSTTLTFTIDNRASVISASGLNFTDNLPAGLQVANPAVTSNTCGGTLTASPGATSIGYTGGSLAAGAICTIAVDTTATATGTLTNTTGDLTSSSGNSGSVSADLLVEPQAVFSKAFAPNPAAVGDEVALTFTIDNSASTSPTNMLSFVDTLPSDVTVANPPNTAQFCGAGMVVAAAGGSSIQYSGGAVGAGASCTIMVDVVASAAGNFTNLSDPLETSFGQSNAATDTLRINPAPGFAKAFAPTDVAQNQVSTLTFTIDNLASTAAATALDFFDNLPANLVVAATPNTSTTCTGGTLSAPASATSISYAGGSVPAGTACTLSVDVVSVQAGTYNNTSADLTSSLGNSGPASATLVVSAPPMFDKLFGTNPAVTGAPITLTFTIDNTLSGIDVLGLTFNDPLPAGLSVATPPNVMSTCAGTVTANAGDSSIMVVGGTVNAGASCTLSVDVVANQTGDLVNVTSDLTSNAGNSGAANDTVTVNTQPGFDKIFAISPAQVAQAVALTFTVDNSTSTVVADSLAFTDNLPAGLMVATPPNVANTCGGTLTATAGAAVISLTGGTVTAGASCTITVDVVADQQGQFNNVTSDLTSSLGTSSPATATLDVDQEAPGFAKAFVPSIIQPNGTSTLTFTIDNAANGGDVSALSFTDNLPAGLLVATPPNASSSCNGGTLTATAGGGTISYNGGSVTAVGNCTLSVDVTAANAGNYDNVTSPLDSDAGQAPAAMATLVVANGVVVTKSFASTPVLPGGDVMLNFTLTNIADQAASDISFTDDLAAALAGLTALDTPQSDVCGAGSSLSGTDNLSFAGGQLAANSDCSFAVTVRVPADAADGDYDNQTSTVMAVLGGETLTNPPATATLTVARLTFVKTFIVDQVAPGDSVDLRFDITNPDTLNAVSGLSFTDDLDAVIPGLVASGTPLAAVCGAGSDLSGADVLILTNGSLAAGGTCSFTVTLSLPAAAPIGVATNLTSVLSADAVGAGDVPVSNIAGAATDDLTVLGTPFVSKAFGGVVNPGDTVSLSFTVTNPDPVQTATDIAFTDDLTTVLTGLAATDTPLDDVCGVGSSLSGTTVLSFAGGTLAPGASCSFSVTLQVPLTANVGTYLNVTSPVTAVIAGGPVIGVAGTSGQANLGIGRAAIAIPVNGPMLAILIALMVVMAGAILRRSARETLQAGTSGR